MSKAFHCEPRGPAAYDRSPPGSIVNLASWAGKTGNAYFAGYSASKFAVIGLTQAFAREMAPHGIRVNAICPGIVVDTAMRAEIEAQQRQYGLPETAEREKSIPIGRFRCPRTWPASPPSSPPTKRLI